MEPFWPDVCGIVRKPRIDYPRSYSNWKWHFDEVFVKINGETYYLWRAVDHRGVVLDEFATKRQDRKSALKFSKKKMKRYGRPEIVVTDKLRSYKAEMKVIGNEARQKTGRRLNNRAENSDQRFRRREGVMSKFRSVKSLLKFVSPMPRSTTTSTRVVT